MPLRCKKTTKSLHAARKKRGFALIVILFFVVLLTTLAVAFLARALTARISSANSTGQAKAILLANTAGEITTLDFLSEIKAGSTTSSPAKGFSLYLPKPTSAGNSSAFPPVTAGISTAVPALAGIPTPVFANGVETDGLANILKVSKAGVPFYDNTANANYGNKGVIRVATPTSPPISVTINGTATTVPAISTMAPDLSGHYISPSSWNATYLIGRLNPGAGLDPTPVTNFPIPDWILVARDGSTPITTTAPNSPPTPGDINDPIGAAGSQPNANYVIGRYSYVVYNEGGLLDMNVAGHPNSLTAAQIGTYKNTVAMADLTQLPVTPGIRQLPEINSLVGWRNRYSSGLSGNYYPAGFNASSSANWMTNFLLPNANSTNVLTPDNGFMSVSTNAPSGGTANTTDQLFLSRQELIKLSQSLNISPDALQYMGTFSRALEQPSYAPDPNRPTILRPDSPPPVISSASSYLGNNDATGGDAFINPAFLSIRVAANASWKRINGTKVIPGEPLVKTKFPLSRLAVVTYNFTNALTAPQATGETGNAVYDNFGLYHPSGANYWIYDHGSKNGSGQTIIGTLDKVAAAGREPDFAELLKAAITTGSLAKGAPDLGNTHTSNFQYSVDISTDTQILQIMANLIDQQDNDSYPTRIQFPGNGIIVSGVEDLPYIYRWHTMSLVDRLPDPPPFSQTQNPLTIATNATAGMQSGGTPVTATGTNGSASGVSGSWRPGGGTYTVYGIQKQASGEFYPYNKGAGPQPSTYLKDPGEVTHLFVLDLWNPHDPNSLANEDQNKRPLLYRLSATTQDPQGQTHQWALSYHPSYNITGGNPATLINQGNTTSAAGNPGATPYWNRAQTEAPGGFGLSGTLPQTTNQPSSPAASTFLTFTDGPSGQLGTLFREPTLLWHSNANNNLQADPADAGSNYPATVLNVPPGPAGTKPTGMPKTGLPDPVGGASNYFGLVAAQFPVSEQFTLAADSGPTSDLPGDGVYIIQLYQLTMGNPSGQTFVDADVNGQMTFTLEYQDPNNSSKWIPYDWKYPDFNGVNSTPSSGNVKRSPIVILKKDDYPQGVNGWQNMIANQQMTNDGTVVDPRTGRWGFSGIIDYTTTKLDALDGKGPDFSVLNNQEPGVDKGYYAVAGIPGSITAGGSQNARWFNTAHFYHGMMAFNNPALSITGTAANQQQYYEDADGIARRASGAYNTTSSATLDATAGTQLPAGSTAPGMPMATANTYSGSPIGTATQQSQSRPFILNRAFRSVEEMGYAFTGTPWKNIDFFTPESGDAALLDTFCVGEPPTNGIVAGKFDLNTRQEPVLRAIEAGTSRDEAANAASPPSYKLPPLTATEADNIAKSLINYTTFPYANPGQVSKVAWRGPLSNVSELVGKYVSSPGTAITGSLPAPGTASVNGESYTYATPSSVAPPVNAAGNSLPVNTYAGFIGALNGATCFTDASSASIQRLRESALRPLVDAGQTRVWNLLIDVVAQSGHYPKTATGLDQFVVEGEKRIWLHVAIDRYTGQVLDKQVEVVAQ